MESLESSLVYDLGFEVLGLDSFGIAIAEFGNFALESSVLDLGFGIRGLDSFGFAIAEFGKFALESLV